MRRFAGSRAAIALVFLMLPTPAGAQDAAEHQHDQPTPAPSWQWSADANAFFGYNYQQRLFADFSAWESQNWLMLSAGRGFGRDGLSFASMISFEPMTIDPRGSPQLFQTGEAYQGVPLVNFQHPHDLVMELGARYQMPRGRDTYSLGADLVGPPALGPTPFMHRASARNNPQVPLTHHFTDSTHISTSVLSVGARVGEVTVEASAFGGAEPDDHRYNIAPPRLDSWSARLGWRRGAWTAQVSGGHLHEPEPFEQVDVARLTASLTYEGLVRSQPLAMTFVWGQNRAETGFNGTSNGYLFEWDATATANDILYGRAEVAQKELFGLGAHPPGLRHPAFYYTVSAVTAGYLREILSNRFSRLGAGGDVTFYSMASGLEPYYAPSRSYHVFLRWRPGSTPAHVH